MHLKKVVQVEREKEQDYLAKQASVKERIASLSQLN